MRQETKIYSLFILPFYIYLYYYLHQYSLILCVNFSYCLVSLNTHSFIN